MATADLKWRFEQTDLKLERTFANNERVKAMIQRSLELLARAKDLLSEPAPQPTLGLVPPRCTNCGAFFFSHDVATLGSGAGNAFRPDHCQICGER